MNVETVYKKINDNNIKIFHYGLPGIKSVSIETENKYGIFINHKEIKNSEEEFCVAAHEYGHCVSGATHKLYSPFDIISRHEYRADRRSVIDFLPIDKIKDAIECGCRTPYDFSKHLDVPEQFIIKAFEHYNAMNLI